MTSLGNELIWKLINSLWPGNAIWWHGSGSFLFLSMYLTWNNAGLSMLIYAHTHTHTPHTHPTTQRLEPFGQCKLKLNTANKANLRDLIAATGLVISNSIQIVNFSARVTVKFDGWPQKTIWHFFYTTSSFVHHFKSIGEFKLDLQSRNAQIRSKMVICYPAWPWNLMDDLGKQ